MEASIQTGQQSATQTMPLPALEAIDVRKSLPLGREQIEILKGVSLRIGNLNGGDLAVHIEGGLGGITQAQLHY